MYTELTTWGYNDVRSDPTRVIKCDFSANGRDMQTAFDALGIDTRSSLAGGSNICFTLEHCNGPTVKRGANGEVPTLMWQRYDAHGKEYTVT
jgi:hypothetical protein